MLVQVSAYQQEQLSGSYLLKYQYCQRLRNERFYYKLCDTALECRMILFDLSFTRVNEDFASSQFKPKFDPNFDACQAVQTKTEVFKQMFCKMSLQNDSRDKGKIFFSLPLFVVNVVLDN